MSKIQRGTCVRSPKHKGGFSGTVLSIHKDPLYSPHQRKFKKGKYAIIYDIEMRKKCEVPLDWLKIIKKERCR